MKKIVKKFFIRDSAEMINFAAKIGEKLSGGEIFELVGDVGAGKTTFVKGLARGLKIDENIQSPSFTISHNYSTKSGLNLHHYDFYRLNDPGIMKIEISENLQNPKSITVIEWGESIREILPENHILIKINFRENDAREIYVFAESEKIALFEN